MKQKDEDKLQQHIRQTLDDSVEQLDAGTLSAIRQCRARAVDAATEKPSHWFGLTAGAVATACVLLVAIMLVNHTPEPLPEVPVADIDMIASAEDLEILQALEFYEWLEENAIAGL